MSEHGVIEIDEESPAGEDVPVAVAAPAAARPSAARPSARVGRVSLASLILEAEARVREALACMPSGLAEAREFISTRFWSEPRPEDLQTLVRVASQPLFRGERREVPLQAIALRYLAERQAAAYWDPSLRSAPALRRHAETLSQLGEVMAIFEARLETEIDALPGVPSDDRSQILRATRVLFPRLETIAGPAVLAPKLASLLEAEDIEALQSLFPTVTDDEAALFATNSPARAEDGPAWLRTALDAAALRARLEDDLASWETLTRFPEGSRPEAVRADIMQNLIRDQQAHRQVTEALQALQDAAVKERRKEMSDQIVRLRAPLSATFRRLAPVFQAHPELRAATTAPASAEESAHRAAQAGHAAAAGADESTASAEAVEAARVAVAARRLARSRRRRIAALAVGLVAVGTMMVVRLMLPPPLPRPIRVQPSDFTGIAPITFTQPVGVLLIARVSDGWDSLSEADRLAAVDSVSKIAIQRGFTTLSLMAPAGDTVAMWDAAHGARLISPTVDLPASPNKPTRPTADTRPRE